MEGSREIGIVPENRQSWKMTKAPGDMGAFEPTLERTWATSETGAPVAYGYVLWGCGREQPAGVCAGLLA